MVFGPVSLVFLALLIRDDLKTRSIHIGWLVLFGLSTLVSSVSTFGFQAAFTAWAWNCLLVLYLYVSLCGYVSVRNGKWTISLRGLIGSGDWWFMICLAPGFTWRTFTWFLVISFLLSLAVYGIAVRITGRRKTIPLVATVGVIYGFLYVFKLIT